MSYDFLFLRSYNSINHYIIFPSDLSVAFNDVKKAFDDAEANHNKAMDEYKNVKETFDQVKEQSKGNIFLNQFFLNL